MLSTWGLAPVGAVPTLFWFTNFCKKLIYLTPGQVNPLNNNTQLIQNATEAIEWKAKPKSGNLLDGVD